MTFCQFLDLAFAVCPHWQPLSLRPLPVFEVGLLAFIPASWCHAYTGSVKTLTTKMWDIFLSGVFINCKYVTPLLCCFFKTPENHSFSSIILKTHY